MSKEMMMKRSHKLAFYGVVSGEGVTYHRMTGFTEFAKTANAKEYKRQYVDEEFERSDVVGYSPAFAYEFDRFIGNAVHSDIAEITERELTGDDAVRSVVIADLSGDAADGGYPAVKREFALIPDSEGDSMEAYTYSGTMKAAGERCFGTVRSEDGWKTLQFTESV